MIKKSSPWLTLPAVLLLLPLLLQQAVRAEPEAPEAAPEWAAPISITSLSASSPFIPVVAASPDGRTVMIVYNREISSGNRDPWFTRSSNNGTNWTAPQPIRTSPADSVQVHVTYDAGSRAHAVWREGSDLAYANDSNWTGTFRLLSQPGNIPPGASNPIIVSSGANTLDVVWSEGIGNPDIYHIRSIDRGSNWSAKKAIATTSPSSLVPALAVDASGLLHAVWEEHPDPTKPAAGVIYYAQGTPAGSNNVNWTPVTPLSGTSDGRQPKIIADRNNTVHVSFTVFVSQSQQYVYHLACKSNCTDILSWSNPSGSNPVSGAGALAANLSDPVVISTMTTHRGCALVYFHGIQVSESNERVLGVNSCDGWSAGGRDVVPSPGPRSLHPSITSQNNWWVYLVYEQVQVTTTNRQVFFVRNRPALYMPIMLRQ
ncbi:MAG TPA: hypothetical protein VF177_15260 [Anaerolineae bacterium]